MTFKTIYQEEIPEQGKGFVWLIALSDIKEIYREDDVITGFKMKRKYGKFKREIIKDELPKTELKT